MKKDNKTDNRKALANTIKKAIEKVGNLIAPTDKSLTPTFDKWAWWNSLSEDWKYTFGNAIQHPIDNDTFEVELLDKVLDLTELEGRHSPRIISPLAELKNLKELTFHYSGITNISPLAECKHLTKLHLNGDGAIADISPLAKLKDLTDLKLFFCYRLEDLTPLKKLEHLKKLNLEGTKIKTLEPIQHIKSLRLIVLRNTSVSQSEIDEFKITNPNCKISDSLLD